MTSYDNWKFREHPNQDSIRDYVDGLKMEQVLDMILDLDPKIEDYLRERLIDLMINENADVLY